MPPLNRRRKRGEATIPNPKTTLGYFRYGGFWHFKRQTLKEDCEQFVGLLSKV